MNRPTRSYPIVRGGGRPRFVLAMLLSFSFGVLLVACGDGDAGDGAAEGGASPAEQAAGEEGAADAPKVNVFGAFVDEDASRFEASMVPFEERTGIDVVYEGSGDFESLITVRVEGGNPPDIAAFPQPGLMADFVDRGIVAADTLVDPAAIEGNYAPDWIDMATIDGTMAGVWYRANVKSLVWYPVPELTDAGYEIPTTWDEMIALSDQIVADGGTPWCIGIESSGATGWVATDWVEDIMLRTVSPEDYDRWTRHELDFDSPEVRNAVETMGEIWLNDDYVLGGRTGILTIPFGDAPDPMFDEEPGCWLHRQASFIPAFFPDDVTVGEDVDFFYLPPIDEELGSPVLTAGDIMSAFNERDEVKQLMAYLASGESLRAWVEAGGVVAPHEDAEADWYPSASDRRIAEILAEADTVRFDGSDLMPGAVGAGSFWQGMVDYISGDPLDEILPRIDDSWPSE